MPRFPSPSCRLVGCLAALPAHAKTVQELSRQLGTAFPPSGKSPKAGKVTGHRSFVDMLYVWYARNGGPTATHEFAQSVTHKLYRDGRLFDLTKDWFEEKPPLSVAKVSGRAAAEAKKLQAVLDRYANARPKHLAEHVAATGGGKGGGGNKETK